ncbi:MAG: MBL fold metallo-hydrolase [Alphaproteobacteria bacterium]|jgi:glyoxylase-like metal-dependent hydrolase (beta-lactamase superfamily II)|nr:MBL fold metallo-hydrolase [Rhodospirillaceae bacterium]MDG2482083.1 MBL fold metallo-hydrolase [Alphaproteobacteria bacterium]MBT6202746.1 MBL fold metallo-hydrolase [Rhodospirillaceae bacterium]MBT6510056.1 MBL fold metallo-hydrolase [Rhodospirillaceae bacterium]MBT7615369.1 MBL fold metallo-hydrolase [Rhodospirillaceae bacterium]
MTLEVATEWYASETISDDVTLIWEPHIDPAVRCNMWHIRGRDRDLLVDSGFGVAPLRKSIALLTEKEILCVGSHSHFDHVGAHDEFEHRLMHKSEAHIMERPTRENTLAENYVDWPVFLALPYADFDPKRYNVRAAPPTRLIDEGDVIDLGDRVLKVLHFPGHSPGGIGLLEEATGLFFSGDQIYDGHLFADSYEKADEEYIESMEKLKELPVTTCHGGHYGSASRARMIELADEYIAGQRKPGCPAEG